MLVVACARGVSRAALSVGAFVCVECGGSLVASEIGDSGEVGGCDDDPP